ncbi:MAG: putative deoxyribonuclease YcfH [Betaproteobacteria bacterium ADurb.Bin341]|nr:MAG: putative deoxyribonuclease YcfH [Betaproteobacteria bacterium ADurb.Bin341]
MLVDSHCHLDFPDFSERLPELLAAMRQNGVGAAVCIGVNLEDFGQVLALAETHEQLYATVGVHPEYTDAEEPDVGRLVQLADHPKVIGIGETGLDYYWQKDKPEWQRQRFRTHIRAAKACSKPLVIHMRDAAEDTLRLLQEEGAEAVGGVMHCFTGNWAVAQQALDLGFHLSFSGIVTFKNATEIREVAQKAPLERILVETDAPYLAPVPYRGKRNQPAYVRYVAEEIACLRGIDFAAVAQATTDNFFNLFQTAKRPVNL